MADLPPDYREGIIESYARSILSLGYLGRDLGIENKKLKEEVAFLKEEVERLTAFTTRTIIPNELLKAEVKRLKNNGEYINGEAE